MLRHIWNEETDEKRRAVWFHLIGLDGQPLTGEAGGQPNYTDGDGGMLDEGLSVLHNPDGETSGENPEGIYYAVFDAERLATAGLQYETSYSSVSCPRQPGDSVQVVDHPPYRSPATLLLDATIENDLSFKKMFQVLLAAVVGKTTGAGGDTEVFKAIDGDQVRITATYDARGNRTALTFSFS